MSYDDDDYWFGEVHGSKNLNAPKGVHIMNKDEAKLCRKIMSDTGLSETEVREHKKYRKMLSEAQKEGEKRLRSSLQKTKDDLMKKATRETKLAKEHPKTKEVYARNVREYKAKGKNWFGYHSWGERELSEKY